MVNPHLSPQKPCKFGNNAPMCLGRCFTFLLLVMLNRLTVLFRDAPRTKASLSTGSLTTHIVELNVQETFNEAAIKAVKIINDTQSMSYLAYSLQSNLIPIEQILGRVHYKNYQYRHYFENRGILMRRLVYLELKDSKT